MSLPAWHRPPSRRQEDEHGLIARLETWARHEVVKGWLECRGEQSCCVRRLQAVPGWLRHGSHCGESTRSIHDPQEHRLRDLPIFAHRVELIVLRVRVACARCDPKLKQLSWLEPYVRLTRRLAEPVAQRYRVVSIRHVASVFSLDWKTVKNMSFTHLQRPLGPIDLDGLKAIGMDKFAISKGHRSAHPIDRISIPVLRPGLSRRIQGEGDLGTAGKAAGAARSRM
ncbi:MAG: transposase family protein [Burkholderiaceae bacterium]